MKKSDSLTDVIDRMLPYDKDEGEIIQFLSRPNRPNDPYEAMLRETFAIYTIIARRMSRQLYEEEIFVTGGVYDMQSHKYEIPKTLTAHLRLLRELRAQYRFLNEYVKNPLPVDTPGEEDEHTSKPESQTADSTANGSASPSPNAPEKKPTTSQSTKNPPRKSVIPSKAGTVHAIDRDIADSPEPNAPLSRDPTPPLETVHPDLEDLLAPGANAACARSSPSEDPIGSPQSATSPSNGRVPEGRIDAEEGNKH